MEPEPLRIAFATSEYVTEEYFYGGLANYTHAGALAETIARAWTHPNLAQMGEAARLKMSEFAPERTVATLLEYYREALGR